MHRFILFLIGVMCNIVTYKSAFGFLTHQLSIGPVVIYECKCENVEDTCRSITQQKSGRNNQSKQDYSNLCVNEAKYYCSIFLMTEQHCGQVVN